jgi:glycosyltransferase involved in cell wall biosynthesis
VRVAYYTHPAFFEPALSVVRELSRRVEVDLLLEIGPAAWQTAAFDLRPRTLAAGLLQADPILREVFPPGVRDYWRSAASFHLVIHQSRASLHPASFGISRRVLSFVRSAGADILHVDDVDVSPRLALALPLGSRPPMVVAVHDPEPHLGEHHWRKRLARRLAYPRASRFILYSAALRDIFAERNGIDPRIIETTSLGAYEVFREWGSSFCSAAATPTVLFFGRLSPYKGLDVFYEAARLVAHRHRNRVRFIVAGQALPNYVPQAPPQLDPPATIEVTNRYISNTEVADLFGSATVVVCPYRDATQSGVALTAFAFGVPVVASAVGGLPEYVVPEQTGLLVPPGNPAALADAIGRILDDSALATRIRLGIREAAETWLSWRHTADALVRTYEFV